MSVGSRAICYAKRALEILDRLGCGAADRRQGHRVERRQGLLPRRARLSLRPPSRARSSPPGVRQSAAILARGVSGRARAESSTASSCAGRTRSSASTPRDDGVDVTRRDARRRIPARMRLADRRRRLEEPGAARCSASNGEGQVFRDRFLIADIHMKSNFPTERWFWFDPPFHPDQSALLHRQADDVWRIDFQLGWDADPDAEKQPERIMPRLRAMLGEGADFEIEWASVYTFQCRRMQRFRHGRVLFAGDAAHVVSPFGARGANSGIQDADNLVWKLDARDPRARAGASARHLRRGAHLRGRREHPQLDAVDRFHHAEEHGVAHVSRCRARAREAPRVRAPARQQRPAVGAGDPCFIAAQHADDRDADFACGAGAMVPGAPAADAPVEGSVGPMAARLSRRRVHAACVRRDDRAVGCRVRSRAIASAVASSRSAGQSSPATARVDDVEGLAHRPLRRAARHRAICCGPISTSARAGARSISGACAPRSRRATCND